MYIYRQPMNRQTIDLCTTTHSASSHPPDFAICSAEGEGLVIHYSDIYRTSLGEQCRHTDLRLYGGIR